MSDERETGDSHPEPMEEEEEEYEDENGEEEEKVAKDMSRGSSEVASRSSAKRAVP